MSPAFSLSHHSQVKFIKYSKITHSFLSEWLVIDSMLQSSCQSDIDVTPHRKYGTRPPCDAREVSSTKWPEGQTAVCESDIQYHVCLQKKTFWLSSFWTDVLLNWEELTKNLKKIICPFWKYVPNFCPIYNRILFNICMGRMWWNLSQLWALCQVLPDIVSNIYC